MTYDIQRSFAAGEIAPALYARADQARFNTALRTCRNMIVRKEGGIKRRTGTQFIAEIPDNARLVDFTFSDAQTYMLVMMPSKMWIIKNGAVVTAGSPAAYAGGTTYAVGALVSSGGINYYSIQASNTGNTPASSPLWWHAMPTGVYEVPTPYADPYTIDWAQSGDVVTIVHPDVQITELTRTGDTSWVFAAATISGSQFTGAGNYPSTVAIFQQRRVFAATNTYPEKIWLSRVGSYGDFDPPGTGDADPFSFSLASGKISKVRKIIEVAGRLICLSDSYEWVIAGDSNGTVTPTAINAKLYSYNGTKAIRPAVLNSTLIYPQLRGTVLHDMRWDFSTESLQSRDLTIWSSHLFQGHTITRIAYQGTPDTVVWVLRDDGVLLGLTYLPEQDVWGWHKHDSYSTIDISGTTITLLDPILDIATTTEGTTDAAYMVVYRLDGSGLPMYCVERVADQFLGDMSTAWYVDSGLEYDGTITTPYFTLSSFTGGWAYDDTITITAPSAYFSGSINYIGNEWVHAGVGGSDPVRIEITAYVSTTVIRGRPITEIPTALRGVTSYGWSRAVKTVAGLDHLENHTVAILADGGVEPEQIVTGGTITLQNACSRIVVGLPFVAEAELLDLESPSGLTLIDKKKRVARILMLVENSRSMTVSVDGGATWEEPNTRSTEDYGVAPALTTGVVHVLLPAEWNEHGRVIIRQADPQPFTLLAAAPQYDVSE